MKQQVSETRTIQVSGNDYAEYYKKVNEFGKMKHWNQDKINKMLSNKVAFNKEYTLVSVFHFLILFYILFYSISDKKTVLRRDRQMRRQRTSRDFMSMVWREKPNCCVQKKRRKELKQRKLTCSQHSN